jgi:ubiquinone/menaquinone biosynthesis C-methylase UbiE
LPERARDAARAITAEFARAAATFGERTAGRFDNLDAVAFARVRPGDSVAEVGAGTGNFLSLFAGVAGRLIAVDLTLEMLRSARARHEGLHTVVGDGHRLPLASRSIDLVASAQVLHHVAEPAPFLSEMRRVAAGRVLVVDQVAPERFEEAVAMTQLETARDPTHASSRPASALRILLANASLKIVDERIVTGRQRFSDWMWAEEFPPERIHAVRDFIERRGHETGMGFERDGDDYVFERRRMMLLAERA